LTTGEGFCLLHRPYLRVSSLTGGGSVSGEIGKRIISPGHENEKQGFVDSRIKQGVLAKGRSAGKGPKGNNEKKNRLEKTIRCGPPNVPHAGEQKKRREWEDRTSSVGDHGGKSPCNKTGVSTSPNAQRPERDNIGEGQRKGMFGNEGRQ